MFHASFFPLAINFPMGAEWIVIAALGLLIFGKRLPDVGRGIGGAIRNFKSGLNDATEQVDEASDAPPSRLVESTPKARFDPYTGKPIEAKTTH